MIPHLAATYAMRITSKILFNQWRDFLIELHASQIKDKELAALKGMEMHALSSALKPLCAWTSRDAIQDCRESCGGHGYLKGNLYSKKEKKILIIKKSCFFNF